jgi:hypothetical protein
MEEHFMRSLWILGLLFGAHAFAARTAMMSDASVTQPCQAVWTACENADVKDAKTGKKGYQYGEAKDGTGLWAQCVGPLAHGRPVTGLASPPPTQQAAEACIQARNNFCQAHAEDACHHKH